MNRLITVTDPSFEKHLNLLRCVFSTVTSLILCVIETLLRRHWRLTCIDPYCNIIDTFSYIIETLLRRYWNLITMFSSLRVLWRNRCPCFDPCYNITDPFSDIIETLMWHYWNFTSTKKKSHLLWSLLRHHWLF